MYLHEQRRMRELPPVIDLLNQSQWSLESRCILCVREQNTNILQQYRYEVLIRLKVITFPFSFYFKYKQSSRSQKEGERLPLNKKILRLLLLKCKYLKYDQMYRIFLIIRNIRYKICFSL